MLVIDDDSLISRRDEIVKLIERHGGEVESFMSDMYSEWNDVVEQTLTLHEERLVADKESVETGEVRVRKEVVTETKTIEVPVTREEVVIERHAVRAEDGVSRSGASDNLMASEIREGEEIRIPLSEEEVHFEKRTVPVEEISVGKRQVVETRSATEELRHEEARVESTGKARVSDRSEKEERNLKRPPSRNQFNGDSHAPTP